MKKKFLLGCLFAVGVFATAGIFSVNATQASAEALQVAAVSESTIFWLENNFEMDYGASVRVGTQTTDESGNTVYNGYGIRFTVTAKDDAAKAAFSNLAASDAITGMIIAPYATIKNVTSTSGISDKNELLTAKTVFEEQLFTFAAQGQAWTDNTVYNVQTSLKTTDTTLYGAVINLYAENFLQKYTGIAYVGVPNTYTESGEVAAYTYYFAKYASGENPVTGEIENDVANNTRCMYYVAQRAVETGDSNAAALKKSYIDEFATNEKTKKTASETLFKYTVVHHYVDASGGETLEYEYAGATLAAYGVGAGAALSATAKEKTQGNNVFVVDEAKTGILNRGYLYAGSMTYLHVYYGLKDQREINQEKTNDMLFNTMKNDTAMYFDSTMKVTGSESDPVLGSANSGWGALVGQRSVTFTAEFVNTLIEQNFSKLYIQTAELDVGALSSLIASGNVVVDLIEITGCVTQRLDADIVGYEVVEETSWGQKVATITFTGIAISLPTEKVTDGFTLTAKVGDSTISGTWTLTGLLFG